MKILIIKVFNNIKNVLVGIGLPDLGLRDNIYL